MNKKMNSVARVVAAGGALMVVGIFGAIWFDLQKEYPDTQAQGTGAQLQAKIDRGHYVAISSDCVACHTAPGGKEFAGGYRLDTPFGAILSSNITSDGETGIGRWSKSDFDRAVRHGKGTHGYLYPAMPYTAYVNLSDKDLDDLWAYIKTVPAVSNRVVENQLPFPFNQRWSLAFWNTLFFRKSDRLRDTAMNAEQARGAYLVEGAAHCAVCHTPKNPLGGDTPDYLQGATLGGWYANDLTNNKHVGLGSWSVDQIVQYLKEGANDTSVASGPMAEAVEHSFQYMQDGDLRAIAAYLKTVPASNAPVPEPIQPSDVAMQMGKRTFESQCNACHMTSGAGVRRMIPALAKSPMVNSQDPARIMAVVLQGTEAAVTHGNPTGAGMPRFDWKLSDEQVAAVATYIRNSWGNSSSAVSAEEVKASRSRLNAHPVLK